MSGPVETAQGHPLRHRRHACAHRRRRRARDDPRVRRPVRRRRRLRRRSDGGPHRRVDSGRCGGGARRRVRAGPTGAFPRRLPRRTCAAELEQPGPRKGVMPGVRPLLDALAARDDVLPRAAHRQLRERRARLSSNTSICGATFACGAFGDDAPDRNSLLPKALDARAQAAAAPPAAPRRTSSIVGDTPLDVACAAAAGARSIARGDRTLRVSRQLRDAAAPSRRSRT